MNVDIFGNEIKKLVFGLCDCGYKLPLPSEILSQERNFICPNCGKDNSPLIEDD